MELKDAFKKMIKAYWAEKSLDESDKVAGERRYTKKYFDSMNESDEETKELKGRKNANR